MMKGSGFRLSSFAPQIPSSSASQLLSSLVLCLLVPCFCSGVEFEEPATLINFIPDIPLYVKLHGQNEGECYDIHLDGKSLSVMCEGEAVFTDVFPTPGEHQIEAYATFLPSSRGAAASKEFTVTHDDPVPAWLSSDGIKVDRLPASVQEYHQWWYQAGVWGRTWWRGVKAHKQPMDMWNYQEILFDLKPTVTVEFGSRFGGSALFFKDVLIQIHQSDRDWKLLTVDIDHSDLTQEVFDSPEIEALKAPSASLRTQNRIEELRKELPGPMFIILDADHGKDNVTLELQMVAPLLEEGDFLIVEDSNLDGHPAAVYPGWGPSPYDAIIEFVAMNRKLLRREMDREFKWGSTQSVAGFWTRTGVKGLSINNPLDPSQNPYLNL